MAGARDVQPAVRARIGRRAARSGCALGLLVLLAGCVVLPRTIQVYDPQCRMLARHMVMEAVEIGAIGGCANQGCAAIIIAASAVTAATAIVSGSITVVGNIVYWVERTSQCRTPDAP